MGGDFDAVFAALEEAHVRYLVVGGVAVVLHGHPRFTADLDLVLSLDPPNVRAALAALGCLQYRPRAPVSADGLADPDVRRRWREEQGLTVFCLASPAFPALDIDLFVEEPFPFDEAFARATRADLGSVQVPVASLDDLIALKRCAGRPKDLEDVRALEALASEGDEHD